VRLSFNIVKPSRGSDRLDLTTVSGQIDFRRFRSDAVGTIFTMGNMCDDGSELSARRALALDPRADPSGPPLLPDFCSPNLLPLQRSPGSALETRFRLAQGPIGNVGQMTWIMGREQEHLLPRYRDEHDDICEFNVPLDSPTETLLFDLFLHNSLVYAQGPSPHLYSMLPGETQHAPVGARTELPLATRILDLSTDPLDVTAGEIANYPQIADWTFNRLGQNPADFRGYRLRIRYPLIPTRIAYRFTLLARPPAL